MNREDAKSAKVFFVFPDRGSRSEKVTGPAGRLSVQIIDHAFYAVLHQWYIPVEKEADLRLVQADCERRHPAVTMSFLACFAS